MKKDEKTTNELLNDYNELVAQFNNDPDNSSKLRVLKSWKDAKSKLAERIEILKTKIKPVEINVDELLDTGVVAHLIRSDEHDVCSACGHIVEGDEEICVSCHRVIDVEKVEPVQVETPDLCPGCQHVVYPDEAFCQSCGKQLIYPPEKKKSYRTNGIQWDGTSTRQDDVELKELRVNSNLEIIFNECDGSMNLEKIAKRVSAHPQNLKKQIRTIVRRGYRLEITDGKIKLDVPS